MDHNSTEVTRPAFRRVGVTDNFIKAGDVANASKDWAGIRPITDVAKGSRACAAGSTVSYRVLFKILAQVIASIGCTVEGN